MSEAPRNVEKQGDKADELQKQIIEGKTGKEELAKKEVAPAKDLEDAKKAKEDEDKKKVEAPKKADESLKEIKTDEQDYKQQYLVLQGMIKSDNARHADEIARLNQALEDATRTITNLNSIVSSAQQSKKADEEGQDKGEATKAPDAQPTLKMEDFEGYGQEMSDLVKLANQQAGEIRQLKGQIGTVEKQVGKVGQSIAESAEDRFYNDLDKAVPDYHAINEDKKWLEWLAQVDPLTGRNRQQFLDEAREAFDVKRVANFFKAFKGVNGGVTLDQGSSEVPPDNAGSKDALGEQVMPEQTGAGEGSDLQPKVKTVTFAQYTKAVKDAQTGRITEEEFNKIANQYQRQIGKPAQ